MQSEIYGQLNSEKLAEDSKTAHQIVSEINNFGISDRQRWLLIYYLAMELENVDELKEITSFIKELKGDQIFISKLFDENERKGI